MTHEVPGYSVKDELDRKTTETIEWLLTGYDRGSLSAEQLSMGADVLFMTVSGLADKDFIHIITEIQMMIEKDKRELEDIVKQSESEDSDTYGVW
jgi:hypothetical protein